MQGQTKAEVFIKTLESLLEEEREIRRARLLRQHKAHARKYIQAFPTGFDESRVLPEWTPPVQRVGQAGRGRDSG